MIKTRTFHDVFILDIVGSTSDVALTKGHELDALLREISYCYTQNHRQIAINLEHVSHVDAEAVTALVLARRTEKGVVICFYGMQDKVRHTLGHSGFLTIFKVYPSQREAIESFKEKSVR